MRSTLFTLFALLAFCLPAQAKDCHLTDHRIELSPKFLTNIGFSPSEELFNFLRFENLVVEFNIFGQMNQANSSKGDENQRQLIPTEITLVAWVLSPREYFLSSIKEELSRAREDLRKGHSIAVTGDAFLKYEGVTQLSLSAGIEYIVEEFGIHLAKGLTSVRAILELERQTMGEDLALSINIVVSHTTVHSWIADLVNWDVFSWNTLAKMKGKKRPGTQIRDGIIGKIEEGIKNMNHAIQGFERNFNVESMDSQMKVKVGEFGEVFDQKLKYTERSGFLGLNLVNLTSHGYEKPFADASVALVLNKASLKSDSSSYLSREEACNLQETLVVMDSLSQRFRRESGREEKKEILEHLFEQRTIQQSQLDVQWRKLWDGFHKEHRHNF